MINYSKGNLDKLMGYTSSVYAPGFLLIYYFIFIFFWHSAFHYLQKDAVKNIFLAVGYDDDVFNSSSGLAGAKEEGEGLTQAELNKIQKQ